MSTERVVYLWAGGQSFRVAGDAGAVIYRRIYRLARLNLEIGRMQREVQELSAQGSSPILRSARRKLGQAEGRRDAETAVLRTEGVLL